MSLMCDLFVSHVILWKVSVSVMWYYASDCNDFIIFRVYLQKKKKNTLSICTHTYTNTVTIGVICFKLSWYLLSVKDTEEGNRDWEPVANRTDLITSYSF